MESLARANVNQVHDDSLTLGQRIADHIASLVGSWKFVIGMTSFLALWIIVNVIGIFGLHYDPYPFILLNLCLSFLAGYTGPFIMMSQNRQSDKDRIAAEADYHTNLAAKVEIEEILTRIEAQDVTMIQQHQELLAIVLRQSDAQDAMLTKLDEYEALLKSPTTTRGRAKA